MNCNCIATAIMDIIQLFVGLLDRKYTNVCEYDIIFDPQSAYHVLDELVVSGLATGIDLDELTRDIFGAENQEAAYVGNHAVKIGSKR